MSALEHVFGELVQANASAIRTSANQQGSWRRDLIAVRRRLADLIGQVGAAIEVERSRAPSDGLTEFAARFARMRRALAIHQASWPASVLDTDDPDYRESVRQLRATFDALTKHAALYFNERKTRA